MSRRLLVFGTKTFRITIPDEASVTFGPFSPPTKEGQYNRSDRALAGTLRVYRGAKATANQLLAVFTDVRSFREESIQYEEQVAQEVGSIIWKDDGNNYSREEQRSRSATWVDPTAVPQLASGEEDEEGDF